jgi:hypothetical protein
VADLLPEMRLPGTGMCSGIAGDLEVILVPLALLQWSRFGVDGSLALAFIAVLQDIEPFGVGACREVQQSGGVRPATPSNHLDQAVRCSASG